MTELRNTATSRILLPTKLRQSLVREEVHWPSRGSPASGGLRAGSAFPGLSVTRRLVRQTLYCAFLIALFSGCEQSRDTRTHILIWHQKIGGERDLFNEEVARFNAAHSDVVVDTLYKENEELRNLFVIAAVAGQGPDLIYGPSDNVGVMVTTQTIMPLDKLFAPEYFAAFAPQGMISWRDATWLVGDQIGNHLTLV